tara:strand:+ start:224 stop:739 length:516 start_codon:yes stop_codon:yes gene_type:complete
MIETIDCPFANEIKQNIISWLTNQEFKSVLGEAYKTKEYTEIHIQEIKRLFDWIESLLSEISDKFAYYSNSLYNNEIRRSTKKFKIDSYWALNYPLNSWIQSHNHFPHSLSFTYYINAPQNSAPLIIDHKEHIVKEGQLVVFPSHIMHWVPPAKVEGRTLLSGDIVYLSRF